MVHHGIPRPDVVYRRHHWAESWSSVVNSRIGMQTVLRGGTCSQLGQTVALLNGVGPTSERPKTPSIAPSYVLPRSTNIALFLPSPRNPVKNLK